MTLRSSEKGTVYPSQELPPQVSSGAPSQDKRSNPSERSRACPNCGSSVGLAAKVCGVCGVELPSGAQSIRCRHCRQRSPSDLFICPNCGRELAAAPSRLLSLGVSAIVVVVFALLIGYRAGLFDFAIRSVSTFSRQDLTGQNLEQPLAGANLGGPVAGDSGVDSSPPDQTGKALPVAAGAGGAEMAGLAETATATTTAIPSATATAIPSATATAIPSATATAIPSATATAIPAATATAIPAATATEIPAATATEIPAATETPVLAQESQTEEKTDRYVVQSGDTPSKISNLFGVSVQSLLSVNGMSVEDASRLQIGQELIIPGADFVPVEIPTAASTPTSQSQIRLEAPRLVNPDNGSALSCSQEILLTWAAVPYIGPTDEYEVTLGFIDGPTLADGGESINWLTVMRISDTIWRIRGGDLCVMAPQEYGRQWRWTVQVMDGGTPVSPKSEVRGFGWN